jgi:hypothetical protein
MGLGLFEVLGGKGSGNKGHGGGRGGPGNPGGSTPRGGGGRSRPKAGTALRKVLLDDIADKAKTRKEAPSASFKATSQMSLDGAISRAMRRGVSDEDINKALVKGGMPPMAELTTSPKGGGGKGLPEGFEKDPKQFNWKPKGNRGGYSVRFRFYDESRGESFFDTSFIAGPETKPGKLQLGRVFTESHIYKAPTAESTGIVKALKPGTVLAMTPSWYSPRGDKPQKAFEAVIQKVSSPGGPGGGWIYVDYTQVKKK